MSELIRREDAINAVEMFFKDACLIAGFLAELCDHFCGELPQKPPKEDA